MTAARSSSFRSLKVIFELPPPDGARSSCYRELFCFVTAETGGGVDAWVRTLTDTQLTFTLRMGTQKNLGGPVRAEPVALDKPGVVHLARLRRIERKGWEYFFKYTYHPGRPGRARPDPAAVYDLPFAPGRRYRVTQGQKASNTHKNIEAYAVDWNLRVGDAVHAARAGRVAGAGGWSDSNKRGCGNFIWIAHDDGTYAWYLHLMKDGVAVKRGDTVKTGQLIGHAGDTGKTDGPH
ncbi:MAG: M23 family metallopeptidase, partial [Rhodospirillaceae bacterium]